MHEHGTHERKTLAIFPDLHDQALMSASTEDIMRDIDTVWPTGPAAPAACRVKNAAATHLLLQPHRNSSSCVDAAVSRAVGPVATSGITRSFRQVLADDPCFIVANPRASEAGILLDKSTLRQRAATIAASQGQQGIRQPRGQRTAATNNRALSTNTRAQTSCASSSSVIGSNSGSLRTSTSDRLAGPLRPTEAINVLFPESSPAAETRIMRAAAMLLLAPPHTKQCAQVASIIDRLIGSTTKLGINKPFRQVLAVNPCFIFKPASFVNELVVQLDVAELQRQAAALLQAPAAATTNTAAAAAAAAFGAAAAALMPLGTPNAGQPHQQQLHWQPPAPLPRQQQPHPPAPPAVLVAPRSTQKKPAPAATAAAAAATAMAAQKQQQGPTQRLQDMGGWQAAAAVPVMPLPKSLQLLNAMSPAACAAADVVIIREQQQQQDQLQGMLQHLLTTKLAAVDLEFAEDADGSSSKPSSRSSRPQQKARNQLALLQLFIPEASCPAGRKMWPAAIYLIEVPEQPAAAALLLGRIKEVMEDSKVVKVLHDGRQDSCVLQRQLGIKLKGVLDTQLLAGLAALAAAADGSSHSSNSSSSSSCWDGYLGRSGLGRLYEVYGFPHPTKSSMCKSFDANPRRVSFLGEV